MPGDDPQNRTRTYRSPRRAEQAARTRVRVETAARELFGERGFAATTIATIARRAGVSAPTVYSVYGSKGAILKALLEQMEEAAESARWRTRIEAETDPRLILAAFAMWTRSFFETSRITMAAAREATSDPAVAELAALGDAHRRGALTRLVERLRADGALRCDLTPAQAVDRAWLLTGIEVYLGATHGCGWSPQEYGHWLTQTLQQQLLEGP